MPIDLTETLVVGVSATALFDMSESDKVFKHQLATNPDAAIDEYRKHMLEKENEPLDDGTGMPLIRALLGLNDNKTIKGDGPLVEVVVISRNSPETGFRVLKEIRRKGLPITRSAFIAGEDSSNYLDAFYVDLFLTTNETDAQKVTDSKVCAAALVKAPPSNSQMIVDGQVRFAFDADAVIFSEHSEIINQQENLAEFWSNEDLNKDVPLQDGPYANLLRKISKVKSRLPGQVEYSPVKVAVVTARNAPAEIRVINTLRSWGIYVDQAFFLGGLDKSRFLRAFNPHIFFDDQDSHLESASAWIPSAKVLYPSGSPLVEILATKCLEKAKEKTLDDE